PPWRRRLPLTMLEDVGNAAHNGKIWMYEIANDRLVQVAKHDPARFGDIGSGDVGKALAMGFLKHGHDVMLGTRDSDKVSDWMARHRKAQVGNFADTAKFGEIVVLAVKGTVAAEALRAAGSGNLSGKVVMDATNPIADAPPVNGVLKFFTNLDESL